MSKTLQDPETCSWCLTEVEDSTLVEQPDGARVCEECAPEEEEFHDTGTVLFSDGTMRADCECGWSGTRTSSVEVVQAEKAAHTRMMEALGR